LLTHFREQFGPGIASDVVGDGERTESARALGVYDAFGDAFAGKVSELVDQPNVLQQYRTTGAGGHRMVVVGDGGASGGGEGFLVGHYGFQSVGHKSVSNTSDHRSSQCIYGN